MAANMTPEQMATTPAGRPPPGVVPNFVNPPSNSYLLIIVGSVVMGVMLVTATLRFYTRIFIRRKAAADDWTTLIAVLGASAYFVICMFAVTDGKYGTHMWDLTVAHVVSDVFIICGFFTNWTTALVWPFAKSSFFLMYLDIFKPLKWQRYAIYFGLIVNWLFYLAIIAATLYFTAPAPGQSWQESFGTPRYKKAVTMTLPIAIGSLVLDLYILLLPIFSVWGLQMKTKKKLGVIAVFATGAIACVASSLSIYFKHILNQHSADFSYYVLPVLIMCLVEMCVGITAACMPSMALLFRSRGLSFGSFFASTFRPFSSLWSGKSTAKGTYANGSYGKGSFGKSTHTSDSEDWQSKSGAYVNMESGNHHELGRVKTVNTYIQGGHARHQLSDDRIHLKYGIAQDVDEVDDHHRKRSDF